MVEMGQNRIPFTEDQWCRVVNNVHVLTHPLRCKEEFYPRITDSARDDMLRAIDEMVDMGYQLYENYAKQFHHDSRARSCCPNPDCKNIYSYFWSDWNFCPKCGTELKRTGEFWTERKTT